MVDGDEFRAALGRFAAGVTVVTTLDGNGAPQGITVSAFSSVSLAPPLILICIQRTTSSYAAFLERRAFVVNVLSASQEAVSRQFASRSPDKFKDVPHHPGLEGIPVIEGAIANLECRLVESYGGGDHSIFVGSVERVTVAEDPPLLYFRGSYSRLA